MVHCQLNAALPAGPQAAGRCAEPLLGCTVPGASRWALLWHLRLHLYVRNTSAGQSGVRGGVGVVFLQGTVKALTFLQSTAKTSMRMVSEGGEAGQLARKSRGVGGSAVLCTCGCFVSLLEDEGLYNQKVQANY